MKQVHRERNPAEQTLKPSSRYADSLILKYGRTLMARHILSPVSQFMVSQLFRDDYLIIDDTNTPQQSHSGRLKEYRLAQLCIEAGYRTRVECESIQHDRQHRLQVATQSLKPEARTIALVQAYLPECLHSLSSEEKDELSVTDKTRNLICSRISVGTRHYVVTLPSDLHSLLIDNSGALLAA